MTYQHYSPEPVTFNEQSIMKNLVEREPYYHKHIMYQPRYWYNAYFWDENEQKNGAWPGRIIGHWAGRDKWETFKWIQKAITVEKDRYCVPIEKTTYPAEIELFWRAARRARHTLEGIERDRSNGKDTRKNGLEHDDTKALAEVFGKKHEELEAALFEQSDDPSFLDKLVTQTDEVRRFSFHSSVHDCIPGAPPPPPLSPVLVMPFLLLPLLLTTGRPRRTRCSSTP